MESETENKVEITYESKLKDELMGLIVGFFKEEQGNRITSNNMDGLTLKTSMLLKQNEIIPKPKK